MITLITGTPGAGKTLYAVAEELPKFKGRPLYVDGIADLAIDHFSCAEGVDRWHEWIPDGAVLVIDEVQRIWRPRGAGSNVPPGVAALETHRHKGIDIVLITQHPNLLDPNIRRLVGRHLHIRRLFGWSRALIYEWDSATDPARVTNAIKRSWAYPRKAYALYKSSDQHNKRGQRVPLTFIIAIIGAITLPIVGWYAYDRIAEAKHDPVAPGTSAAAAGAELATNQGGSGFGQGGAVRSAPPSLVAALILADDHNPLSAPLYAAVVPAVTPPEIQGCISSSKACICYSQQSTPVWVPDEQCRKRAEGLYFDPYRQNPPESQTFRTDAPRKAPEATAPPASSGGFEPPGLPAGA